MIYLVNGPLLIVVLVMLGVVYCIRKSPDSMRAVAAWLRATADADDAHKANHASLLKQYRVEMGLPGDKHTKSETYART